jgi:hypothetical protein
MKMATSVYRQCLTMKFTVIIIGWSIVLMTGLVSGCGSVVSNSESFYQNIPRRPINWREYMTD